MKNKCKKFFAAFVIFSMMISMLPAQFALATDETMSEYVTYGSESDLLSSNHKGQVFKLEKVTGQPYDYSLTVSTYNTSLATDYLTAFTYNQEDVKFVRKSGTEYNNTALGLMATMGTVTEYMTSSEDYLDTKISEYLFTEVNELLHEQVDTSNIYKIKIDLGVGQTGITPSEWINGTYGSDCQVLYGHTNYKFPTNRLNTMYTLYFKLQDGKTEITADTFQLVYDDIYEVHGSGSMTLDSSHLPVYQDEKTYLIGFPKPAVAAQTVSFTKVQDKNGSGLSGADIKIYDNSAKAEENLVETITTGGDGTASTTLTANTTYYYTVSSSGYQDKEGQFEVKETSVTVPAIEMTLLSDVKYDTTITVKDADTGAALSGASVTVDSTSLSGTTDSNGQITAQLTASSHGVVASLTGYQTSQTVNFTVSSTGTNAATISLVPERASVTLPTAKDDKNETVSDANVIVTRTTTTDPVNEWSATNTKTYNAGESVQLPKGNKYTLTVAAAGYLSATLYLNVDTDGAVTYYSDSSYSSAVDAPTNITITKLSDPYYHVTVTPGETDTRTYTATVTLSNIAASYGTFGLRYDKDVFDFDSSTGFTIGDELEPYDIIQTGAQVQPIVESATEGYHVFSWVSKAYAENGGADAVFDTRTAPKTVATYTFTLKQGKSEKDITSDAFSVMPYDKTKEGREMLTADSDISIGREFTDYLWRYTNDANDETNPKARRLAASKSALNGFYQVYSEFTGESDIADDEDNSLMYDVMTAFEFDSAKPAITFVVTDENNIALNQAEIKLYDLQNNLADAITTDATGIITYPVDGAEDYQYIASCKGYWDMPETGKLPISSKADETTTEYITLAKKIYHEPVLDISSTITNSDKISLAGNSFAYNGKDFYFYLEPDAGYKISDIKISVIVTDDNGNETPYTPVAADGVYSLSKEYIIGSPISDVPDDIGFESHQIKIKVTDATIEESGETYTVTANAGTNGSVSYTAEAGELPATSETDSNITISGINPTDNTSTGTFTFTADSEYVVEKVIVNGVQIHDYDKLDTFTYSFGNVTGDNDISVTFYDGINPSDEAVVTLVVGPNGTVDVSKPTIEAGVTNTRKTYIYTKEELEALNNTLEFTAAADDGAVLVQKSVNGADKEEVSESEGKYTVAVAKNDVTAVYVSFDENTVFVNAYVESGEGTIDPVGILIMKKHDSLKVTTTAGAAGDDSDKSWSAYAIDVNGKEISNPVANAEKFVYTVEDITEDTLIGAIFTETTYDVTGYVDLSQNSNLTTAEYVNTFAVVTCTRQEDKTTVFAQTTLSRKSAAFTAKLPKGTWDITVKKSGYINYTITGFTVDGSDDQITFGLAADAQDEDEPKKITPYIGNTNGTGKTVSLLDAGVVANGLNTAANSAIKAKADVDDDGNVSATSDMIYIKYNYGQRAVTEDYQTFLTKDAPTPISTESGT